MSPEELKSLFLLDPDITFLNHGSFGACPRPVFERYQQWQIELERQPVQFFQRSAPERLAWARGELETYLNGEADSLVFVNNATSGVNVAIRSLDLEPGDEVLTTNQEYGACTMSWEWLLGKTGARLVRTSLDVPFETADAIVEKLFSAVNDKTQAIYLSHVTSQTATILPVGQICQRAREMGILTVIDGAHAPGHVPVDLQEIGADIYSGNLHKWVCAPKGTGFLYVRPEEQEWIESLVISWGWGPTGELSESTFVDRNEWQGTRDIAGFLTVPDAIAFQQEHDWDSVRTRCHRLASETRSRISDLTSLPPIVPDSPDWFGQMVSCPVESADPRELQGRLWQNHQIETVVSGWEGQALLRASFQGYNDNQDVDRLLSGLEIELNQ